MVEEPPVLMGPNKIHQTACHKLPKMIFIYSTQILNLIFSASN